MDDFRIMTWNILEGFHEKNKADLTDDNTSAWANDSCHDDLVYSDRLLAAQRLVRNFDPQILILNEANWCDPDKHRFTDYGLLFDFPYVATDTYDNEWGNAICSKFPIHSQSVIAIYNRSALVAELEVNGKRLHVATYHPHPSRYSENKKLDFLAIAKSVSGPLIIAGDMNAINPSDDINYELLLKGFERFSMNPQKDLGRFIDGGKVIFPALMEVGFSDVFSSNQKDYSIPTNLLSENKSSGMRIDHILINDYLQSLNAKIVKNSDSEIASDHYPVMADLSFR